MKLVIQRVKQASVSVDDKVVGSINRGMVILLGVDKKDTLKDIDYCVTKATELRMFEDQNNKMNLSSKDVGAEVLIVSQFTLCSNCDKGRRPSFDTAADPVKAQEYYEIFSEKVRERGLRVATGQFRAMMDVSLVNDGPVTFILES